MNKFIAAVLSALFLSALSFCSFGQEQKNDASLLKIEKSIDSIKGTILSLKGKLQGVSDADSTITASIKLLTGKLNVLTEIQKDLKVKKDLPKPGLLKFGAKIRNRRQARVDSIANAVNRKVLPKIDSLTDTVGRVSKRLDDVVANLPGRDTIKITNNNFYPAKDSFRYQIIPIPDQKVYVTKKGDELTGITGNSINELPPGASDTTRFAEQIQALFNSEYYYTNNSVDPASKDTTKTAFQIRLRRKMEVLGFYPLAMLDSGHDDQFNFNVLSSFCVNRLMLDGASGEILNTSFLESDTLITKMNRQGIKVLFTVHLDCRGKGGTFLNNDLAKRKAKQGIKEILQRYNGAGIIVDFENLDKDYSTAFVDFIGELHDLLSSNLHEGSFPDMQVQKLYVVVPSNEPFDNDPPAYDLVMLDDKVDKFIVDFTQYKDKNGPLMPLWGIYENSLANGIRRITNLGIAPSKIIAGISFYGLEWKKSKRNWSPIPTYLPYNEAVDSNFNPLKPDDTTVTVHVSRAFLEIWYDNPATLAKKINYLQSQNIAGVAVIVRNSDNFYDNNYSELWNAIMLRSFDIDTIALYSDVTKSRNKSIFKRLADDWEYYWPLLKNHNLVDPATYHMPSYLGPAFLTDLALLVLLIIAYCILYTRYGITWKFKTPGLIIVIVVGCLDVVIGILYAFLSPDFGIGINFKDRHLGFTDLVTYLAIGLALGVVIMKIIFSFLNKKDIK